MHAYLIYKCKVDAIGLELMYMTRKTYEFNLWVLTLFPRRKPMSYSYFSPRASQCIINVFLPEQASVSIMHFS